MQHATHFRIPLPIVTYRYIPLTTITYRYSADLREGEPNLIKYLPDAELRQLLQLRQPSVSGPLLDALAWLLQGALTWDPADRCMPADALAWIEERGPQSERDWWTADWERQSEPRGKEHI